MSENFKRLSPAALATAALLSGCVSIPHEPLNALPRAKTYDGTNKCCKYEESAPRRADPNFLLLPVPTEQTLRKHTEDII